MRPSEGVCAMAGDILSARHSGILSRFAASNLLLAFDYDGTLAPIASSPARARMRVRTRRLLARAARRYPCVVISGRPLEQLAAKLHRIPVWHLYGNHGFEPSAGTDRHAARVRDWIDRLSRQLLPHEGLVIENKRYTVTVHYRHVRHKRRALEAIRAAVRCLPHVRVTGGEEALNLLPSGGPNKGVALRRARQLFDCETALYVGDDDTDEDAFASGAADRLLSIRVGRRRGSGARYRLRSQLEIDALLQRLVDCRTVRFPPPPVGGLR